MTPRINPEMIGLARELRGLTQAALAELLSVNQTTVSRYEAGLIEPPPDHLQAIAAILGRPLGFFFWHGKRYGASGTFHRKNRSITTTELRSIDAKVNLLRLQGSRLLMHAKVTSSYVFHRQDALGQGGPQACARELRRLWQLPSGPIRNVVGCIEGAGGMVFRCPFGTAKVDGVSQWPLDAADTPPVFFVNDEAPGDRERWTLAHEIGHIVMHHQPTGDDIEEEANVFASEFLMPSEDIGYDLSNMTLQKAAALKSFWKVSMQAIIVWAYKCRKISKPKYQYLFKQMTMRGYRKCEPVPIPPEEPAMFPELLRFYRNTLGRSEGELAEHIGEMPDNFRVLYGHGLSAFRLVG